MTTVLVVDDEYLLTEVITAALEDAGFSVKQASDGQKALEMLMLEQPALVISDFMMPVMNGLELALNMKQRSDWASIPIILMSGAHTEIARQNKHVFSRILNKPFSLSQLVDEVISLVGTPDGDLTPVLI